MISGKMDPYQNMALDEAIYLSVLKGDSPPTIRFYDWQPASFSCGYNQDIEKELDFDLLKNSEYGFVRRPTGGRMVLHEEEVTYAVISTLTGRLSGSISDTYLTIGKALVEGLQDLGVDVELARGDLSREEQKQSANPCFTSSSRFELTYKRKKIVGSAQTRNSRAFLQHGSILKTYNQKRVAEFIPLLTEDDRLRMASLLERRTIALETILNRVVSFDEAVEHLIRGFQREWGEDSFQVVASPTSDEERDSERLKTEKYSTEKWNKKERKTQKEFDTYLSVNRV